MIVRVFFFNLDSIVRNLLTKFKPAILKEFIQAVVPNLFFEVSKKIALV
jgi:hypothetical protein